MPQDSSTRRGSSRPQGTSNVVVKESRPQQPSLPNTVIVYILRLANIRNVNAIVPGILDSVKFFPPPAGDSKLPEHMKYVATVHSFYYDFITRHPNRRWKVNADWWNWTEPNSRLQYWEAYRASTEILHILTRASVGRYWLERGHVMLLHRRSGVWTYKPIVNSFELSRWKLAVDSLKGAFPEVYDNPPVLYDPIDFGYEVDANRVHP